MGARKELLQVITHPGKAKRVRELSDEELRAITRRSLEGEEYDLLAARGLLGLRVIWLRGLDDWESKGAKRTMRVIDEFVGSKGFMEAPNCFLDLNIRARVKVEHIDSHARRGEYLARPDYEAEVVGVRPTGEKEVEALVLHNQIRYARQRHAADAPTMVFSQREYDIPPQATLAGVKRDPGYPATLGMLRVGADLGFDDVEGPVYLTLPALHYDGFGRRGEEDVVLMEAEVLAEVEQGRLPGGLERLMGGFGGERGSGVVVGSGGKK